MKGFWWTGLPMMIGIGAASTIIIVIQKKKFEKKDSDHSIPDLDSEYEVRLFFHLAFSLIVCHSRK
jgi:hypothetical protein